MVKKLLVKPKSSAFKKAAKNVVTNCLTLAKKNISVSECMNNTPYPLKPHQSEGVQFMVQKEIEPAEFKDKLEITQKLNKILEKMITQNPDQWIWSHNKWKQ